MSDKELIALAVSVPATALVMALAHYIPKPKEPGTLERYTWGVAIIAIGFTGWRLANDDWQTPLGLWCFAVACGLVVILSHGWDWALVTWRKVRMIERNDEELQSLR